MILITDSGSTKTDWALVADDGKVLGQMTTDGINPYHQDDATIIETLREVASFSVPSIQEQAGGETSLFFYGSGCTPEQGPRLAKLLSRNVGSISYIEVYSDMMAAARALFGKNKGIACILGTGANSCLYDGRQMVQNTPALGYILGDEGSGAVLGRKFLNALYKGRLPLELKEKFERDCRLNMSDVIQKVYREPLANRFLASLSLFIGQHLDVEPLRQLVIENFREFFRHNVVPYRCPELPVGFVGSMAYHYERELHEAADEEGFIVGQVLQKPMEGLIRFHTA